MAPSACVLASLFLVQLASGIEVPTLRMNNGVPIPQIALGSYLGFGANGVVEPTSDFVDLVAESINIGWRHFDTAWLYKTEKAIGEGIRRKIDDGTVKRSDVFITTKLWNNRHRRDEVVASLRDTLTQMGLDYVDLFLVHWPMGLNDDNSYTSTHYLETWQGMEDCQTLGLARTIGVSNFNQTQLARVITEGNMKPAVLQIEIHLQNVNRELVEYAQSQNIVVMGYSPFGSLVMRHGMDFPGPKLDNPVLTAIAKKYGKTVPQVVLRWLIQRNIIPVAKTTKVNRLEENIKIFDFELDQEEMNQLYSFDTRTRYTLPSFWQNHRFYPFEKVDAAIGDPFKKDYTAVLTQSRDVLSSVV